MKSTASEPGLRPGSDAVLLNPRIDSSSIYINVLHLFSTHVLLSNSLTLSLLLYFLANVRCFQFYEGFFVWKNSNQSVSPWKQAVKLDMATTTKQVELYLQSKGRKSGRGCTS